MLMAMKKPPAVHSDFGTPERRRKGPMVLEAVPDDMVSTKHRDRMRAVEVGDPLWILKRNGRISRIQRDSGLMLRELWNRTGREQRVIGNCYQEMISGGSVDALPLTTIDHYQRFRKAIDIVGRAGSNEVIAVCCMQEMVASNRVRFLRGGLTVLVRYFGIG